LLHISHISVKTNELGYSKQFEHISHGLQLCIKLFFLAT
jgi:hypothetical protein